PLTRIRTFQDLCAADFDVDLYLVQAAGHSPRTLVNLAKLILEEHCQRANTAEELIATDTIHVGVQRGLADAQSYHEIGSIDLPALQPVRDLAPAVPALYIDGHGDIWMGERRMETKLPALMRRCFEYLWQNRHRRMTYDELLNELYGESL